MKRELTNEARAALYGEQYQAARERLAKAEPKIIKAVKTKPCQYCNGTGRNLVIELVDDIAHT